MVGSFTFASSAAILEKAGVNVSSDVSNAMLLRFSDQAEAYVNGVVRVDLIDKFSTLDANFKQVIEDLTATYAGMKAIGYDPTNFESLLEAQTKLDLLRDDLERLTAMIKEDSWKTASGAT